MNNISLFEVFQHQNWIYSNSHWLALVTILVSVLYFGVWSGGGGSKLPPSPPRLPIIGNLHQITPLAHRSLQSLSAKYGPIMLLQMGQVSAIVISSPDVAREVLRVQDHVYADRPQMRAGNILTYGQKNPSLAPYGEYSRKVKKMCITHLLNSKRVQSFRSTREEEVQSLIENIKKFSSDHSGQVKEPLVDLSDLMYDLTNNIVIRATTGAHHGHDTDSKKFKELLEEAVTLVDGFQVDDMFPFLGWLRSSIGMDLKLRRFFKKWDLFLNQIVEAHTNNSHIDGDSSNFVDVLLSLKNDPTAIDLELSKDDIKTIVMDMYGAGTDTTHSVLEWAMTELMRNPKIMKKVQDEVGEAIGDDKRMVSEEHIDKLVYLKAVIKETLRLHTPAPLLLPHQTIQETSLMGYSVPKNTRVIINAWAIARDPEFWDSPGEFLPERFLNGGDDVYMGQDYKFLPFGSGRRMCPGIRFATSTIELTLANLLYHFEWSMGGGRSGEELDVDQKPGITIKRANALRLVALPRWI